MAELADAHGSGPCESNFMQVQVLLPAPKGRFFKPLFFSEKLENSIEKHSLAFILLFTVNINSSVLIRHT